MIEPMTIHTPIDAIERAKEHARDAEDAFAGLEDASYVQELQLQIQLGQLWAAIAIAQRSGR